LTNAKEIIVSIAQTFLPEFEHEMTGTRKILELVPDNLLDWKAHETLNTIGWLGSHIADTLSWVKSVVNETSFDVAPVGGTPHQSPVFGSRDEILATFDANLSEAKPLIAGAADEQLFVPWSLLQGGEAIFTMPRIAVMKTFFINHLVHHRAFLISYLRMNGIDCPPMYS